MAYTTHESESIGGLLRGAVDDVRELVREELLLARTELKQELNKAKAAGFQFGVAGAALWFAATFLLVAVALGIAALFQWPAWAGFALVAVLLGVSGLVFAANGRRAVRDVKALPHTVHSIKENFQ